jgi:hypothetical protein
VDVLTRTGRRYVIDVRTVNVQRASAAKSSAEAQCAAIEAEKHRHYSKYDRSFAPFVITLSGAVSQASAEVLARMMKTVARGDRNVLDWEPARWTEDILHRLAVELVKTGAVIATRAVLPAQEQQRARRPPRRNAMPCRAWTCVPSPRGVCPQRRDAMLCGAVPRAPDRRALSSSSSSCHELWRES